MNNTIPYLQNNTSFNPLYAKMRERFCADGTIAERMATEAGLSKKRARKTATSEYHMTHANSLPKRSEKQSFGKAKKLFSLQHLGVFSMALLIVGMLFFSGATFDNLQSGFARTASQKEAVVQAEEDRIRIETPTSFENSLGFTKEHADPNL